ncbi:MAG: hypothetical protein Q8P49_02310 [Candidatus Liptonbacteria bacterium]|nr:hypothetical protein [Candidatus Liptonbacteria bacterium]
MPDYSKYKIKDYKHWEITIHENQGYLGRCVIWCKRSDALDLAGATEEEYEELLAILRDLKDAVAKAFRPDWFNYAFLGNETRHLHGHLVPRYAAPRTFEGIIFEDKLWGHNYKTDPAFRISETVLQKIKKAIINEI